MSKELSQSSSLKKSLIESINTQASSIKNLLGYAKDFSKKIADIFKRLKYDEDIIKYHDEYIKALLKQVETLEDKVKKLETYSYSRPPRPQSTVSSRK